MTNRKFYWNSFENYFEPILYDANPDISLNFSTTTTAEKCFQFLMVMNSEILKKKYLILIFKIKK